MSYVVNTGTVEFYRGCQNYVGSVPVSVCGMPAEFTPKDSSTQRERPLGSRRTVRAGHCCVSGWHQHHLSARPPATLDQFTFRHPDRGISRLTGHSGTSQEQGLEILDCDGVMVGNNPSGPHTSSMSILTGCLLVQASHFTARALVAPRRGLSTGAATARHLPLRSGQLRSAPTTVARIGQVVGEACCRSGCSDSPINPDRGVGRWRWRQRAASYERRVPMSQAVLVDTNRCWCGGQLTRPHNWYRHAVRQPQSAIADRKSPRCVLQRWQGRLARLGSRSASAFDRERMLQGNSVSSQGLLLGDLRSRAQPRSSTSCGGQHLGQMRERRFRAATLLVDCTTDIKPVSLWMIGAAR